jgi:hypothetical protein
MQDPMLIEMPAKQAFGKKKSKIQTSNFYQQKCVNPKFFGFEQKLDKNGHHFLWKSGLNIIKVWMKKKLNFLLGYQ